LELKRGGVVSVDLVTAANLAGHADINVTRSYATPSIEKMVDVLDKLYN